MRSEKTFLMDVMRKAYFAQARARGIDALTAKNNAKEKYKLESFNDITWEQLRELTTKQGGWRSYVSGLSRRVRGSNPRPACLEVNYERTNKKTKGGIKRNTSRTSGYQG